VGRDDLIQQKAQYSDELLFLLVVQDVTKQKGVKGKAINAL